MWLQTKVDNSSYCTLYTFTPYIVAMARPKRPSPFSNLSKFLEGSETKIYHLFEIQQKRFRKFESKVFNVKAYLKKESKSIEAFLEQRHFSHD